MKLCQLCEYRNLILLFNIPSSVLEHRRQSSKAYNHEQRACDIESNTIRFVNSKNYEGTQENVKNDDSQMCSKKILT